uniref:Uncharacterized protein n=1 Tax=Zea mays TaxID=4577 RepID=B4FZH7_MAIZE|nr:unknown [Zea mays]
MIQRINALGRVRWSVGRRPRRLWSLPFHFLHRPSIEAKLGPSV